MTEEISFERRRLGPAPALIARSTEGPLPAVLWYHGLSVDKDIHRPELERIARAGFLAVGIDAAGHGERRLPDLEERFAGPRQEIEPLLFELIGQTVKEVPEIVDALIESGLAVPGKIGIAGISMGGYIVYGSVVAEPRLHLAVAVLGSPEWSHPESPHLRLDRFFPTALLSITAGLDESVPPQAARRLHDQLAPFYRGSPERLRYRELEGAPHLMGAEDWAITMQEMIEWLGRFGRE